jgi:hypothetical protein
LQFLPEILFVIKLCQRVLPIEITMKMQNNNLMWIFVQLHGSQNHSINGKQKSRTKVS